MCPDADGINLHFGGVVEEWEEVGGDRKDVGEGIAEECRLLASEIDILNEIGTSVRLLMDISPLPLGT